MFYLERQNRKNEKMKKENQKSHILKKTKNIKSQIQCFLEEKHMSKSFCQKMIFSIKKEFLSQN